jgi:DNA primase
VLYGIFSGQTGHRKINNCYLVEGYTDVIQFNQSGIENVVASSGTALTPDQIRLINRLTKNITVLLTVMQPVACFHSRNRFDSGRRNER